MWARKASTLDCACDALAIYWAVVKSDNSHDTRKRHRQRQRYGHTALSRVALLDPVFHCDCSGPMEQIHDCPGVCVPTKSGDRLIF